MNKVYAFIAFFAVLLLGVNAQIQDPVRFVVEQKKTGANELEVRFKATIDEGWHVYGADVPEGGPTAAELTVEKIQGLKAKGGLKVEGKLHRAMDEMFGMEVSYVEHMA